MKTNKDITPEEAKKITQAKQDEADSWLARIDRVVESLRTIQKENGFAPRMEIVFRGHK